MLRVLVEFLAMGRLRYLNVQAEVLGEIRGAEPSVHVLVVF